MEGVSDVGGKLLEDDFVSETVKLDGNSSFGCLGEASETTGGLVSLTYNTTSYPNKLFQNTDSSEKLRSGLVH